MIKDLSKNSKDNSRKRKFKIAIVRSNYYRELAGSLEKACKDHLVSCGIEEGNIITFEVPGSWEIPLLAKKIAKAKKFDGIIAFGIIIKGETFHFELIANECTRALMNISLEFDIPITFEILATYNLEQAKRRSMGKYNKGIEAAKTLLSILETFYEKD